MDSKLNYTQAFSQRSFDSVEAKSYVVGSPVAVSIAEDGFEEIDGIGEGGCSIDRAEVVKDAITEGVEPGLHASGEWRGPRDEYDGLDSEASCFEKTNVERRRREEAGRRSFGVNVKRRESSLERGANSGDVAVTPHLCNETAARA
jgi:hypothetical protein